MSPEARVAVFTDNDFEKVNGVTTTLSAVLRYAPVSVRPRIYTAATLGVDEPQYLALPAWGTPIPFYRTMRMYLPPVRRLLAHARRDRINVVHMTTPGPMGLAAMYVASRLGVPMVGSFHTDLAAYAKTLSGSDRLAALMRAYMRWPYGRCARVLVPSEATRRMLASDGHAHRQVGLWTRGVDTDLFTPEKRSQSLRNDWHVSDRRPALIYVGRVSAEKGLRQLPAMAARLHHMGVQHRWIVVGDGPLLPWLQTAMPDALFTGTLSREDVARTFASADLFVFPSRTDTAGNVVLEAQASGLPVVVSEAGGPSENMVDGSTGLVCEGTGTDTWAGGIASLVRDRPRWERMRRAALTYAGARSWRVALEPIYRAYLDAAEARPAEAAAGVPVTSSSWGPMR